MHCNFVNEKIKLTFVCSNPILPLLNFSPTTPPPFLLYYQHHEQIKCSSHTEDNFGYYFSKAAKKKKNYPNFYHCHIILTHLPSLDFLQESWKRSRQENMLMEK